MNLGFGLTFVTNLPKFSIIVNVNQRAFESEKIEFKFACENESDCEAQFTKERTLTFDVLSNQKLEAECLLGFGFGALTTAALSPGVLLQRRHSRLWFMRGTIREAHAWSGRHEARQLRCGFQRHRGFHLVFALQEVINLVIHRHQVHHQVTFIAIIFPELAAFGQTIPGRHAM